MGLTAIGGAYRVWKSLYKSAPRENRRGDQARGIRTKSYRLSGARVWEGVSQGRGDTINFDGQNTSDLVDQCKRGMSTFFGTLYMLSFEEYLGK